MFKESNRTNELVFRWWKVSTSRRPVFKCGTIRARCDQQLCRGGIGVKPAVTPRACWPIRRQGVLEGIGHRVLLYRDPNVLAWADARPEHPFYRLALLTRRPIKCAIKRRMIKIHPTHRPVEAAVARVRLEWWIQVQLRRIRWEGPTLGNPTLEDRVTTLATALNQLIVLHNTR